MTPISCSRRKFLRTAAVSAAALAGAAALGGCGLGRKPAELSLAASAEDVSDAQIERFNRAYAPYHVTRVALNAKGLSESLSAESAPAVAVVPGLKVAWLAGQGALRDLAGLFQGSAKARGAALYGVDSYFTNGAQRWGMALAWSPDYLVWANRRLWEAAGVALPAEGFSLQAWRQHAWDLSIVRSVSLPFFGADFTFDFPALLWLAETLDPPARLFSGDGRLDLRGSPPFVEAVRFVVDWKKEGGIPFQRVAEPYQPEIVDCVK